MPLAWALAYSWSGIPVPQFPISAVVCAMFFMEQKLNYFVKQMTVLNFKGI